MITKLLPCSPEAFEEAGELIRNGQLVGFPTETVYGLGADALNAEAVKSIFAAKGRPQDNPLIVHISEIDQIYQLIDGPMPKNARLLAENCWPGPLTMIFPRSKLIPDAVTAGLDTVGIRLPQSEYARAFITACRRPIAAPSANRSGRPSPTTAQRVFEDMDGRIPLILDGGDSLFGVESTVLDVSGDVPRILRPGGVTKEQIIEITGGCITDDAVMRPLKEGEKPRSPGMKYRHYAPKAPVTIYEGTKENVISAIKSAYDQTEGAVILAPTDCIACYGKRSTIDMGLDQSTAAHAVFEALRVADDMNATAVFAHAVDYSGMGLAVMNRLGRAAAFHIIKV